MDPTRQEQATLPDPKQWVELYGDLLYRYALARVADPETAKDLVQDSLLSAVRARGSFSGRSSPKTWMVGILKHKIADHFRRRAREASPPESDRDQDFFDLHGRWNDAPPDGSTDPELALGRKEFWRALRTCLNKLPSRQADVFVLREFEGKSTEEICQVCDITTTNLWVLIHRARMGLRRCLENSGFPTAGETANP